MARARCSRSRAFLVLSLLLLAACGPPPTVTPVALLPTATPVVTASPAQTLTPAPSPAATDVPAPSTAAPLEGEGLLAWTVAADGEVFVLDATHTLHRLSPDNLAPMAQSTPLIESKGEAAAYLLTSERYLFAGSSVLSQTLVLDRSDFGLVGRLEGFGPLALEPGQRLLMIPQDLEDTWPSGNFEIWAHDLSELGSPPGRILRNSGASLDDLEIDPASRRLYVLTSNIAASPPHQGQTYVIYSLDTLEEIAGVEWERGSLTSPVINPRTGEAMGSRIGLNSTRRFLILDPEGQEVRNRPSLDGQPVIDAAGEWIYLLRQRGLWVLREQDLSLQSVLPFSQAPPQDLALSPDGESLYLFGNGWLSALSTAELRSQGLAPVSPLPTVWFASDRWEHYVQPRVYPSPQMEEDGVAFMQLVGSMENVLETYHTTDGGHSWVLLPSLMEPDLVGAAFLSLSPDFAKDKTLAARAGSTLVRSADGGLTWQAWQPRIAFASDRDGNREIYTMDLEGDDVQRLTDAPAAEENPAWSPAWSRLAFQSNRNGNWDIFTMRVDCDPLDPEAEDRCDLRHLTDDPADDLLPAWSPDGRAIAFVSTRDGNPEIYVMDSNGGNERRLTFSPTGDWRPAWLPDSTHLVFVSDRGGNNNIYQLVIPPLDAAPLASEPEITPVIVSPADDRDPAVAAGPVERLLFLSDRDGFMRTYAADPHSQPRPFTETDQPEAHPATLPGEYYTILVSAERDGAVDIYRTGLSEYTALAPSPGFDGQPAGEATGWEPDTSLPMLPSFPSANALPASTSADAGPFLLASPDEGLPEGRIHDLWIDPQGYLWVASEQGIVRDSAEGWSQLLDDPVERVQGVDAQGRIWVILEGETAIAAYDTFGTWSFYGPEQGWAVPQALEYLSPGYGDGLVTDAQGQVWLATGRDDLRSFDPETQTWSSLTATDLGFHPPEEEGYQGHFLSDVAVSEEQELWVGDCIGSGEALLGQGVLKSDGQKWFANRSTSGECVQDIERDGIGRMWVGGLDALYQYDPTTGSWLRIPLPPWEWRQLVTDIMLDPNDNPWVEIMRYGGASPLGGLARYHLQEGEWFLDFDGWFSSLAFSSDGVAWLCSEGAIYRLEGGKVEELGNIGGLECEIIIDGEDRVWVTNHSGLWRHEWEE